MSLLRQLHATAGDVSPPHAQEIRFPFGRHKGRLGLYLFVLVHLKNDSYHHLLVATVSPSVVMVILEGSYALGGRINRSSEAARLVLLHEHQAALLCIAFFELFPVSYVISQTLACDELDDGDSYLRADYSLSDVTSCHARCMVCALIIFCEHRIVIAMILACLRGQHRHDLAKTDRDGMAHLNPLHGLFAG